MHFNVTERPTAEWTARQLVEACRMDEIPWYLLRDRDAISGKRFCHQATALGIEELKIAPQLPWQNPYAERVIGSIRRECLDHMIILGPRHLKGIIFKYAECYNGARNHLSLYKDARDRRPTQPPE